MSRIRAVLFDADGVVQRTPPAFRQSLIDVCRANGADPEKFLAAVFAAERPSIVGTGTLAEALAPVLRGFGMTHALDTVLSAWRLVEPDVGVFALIDDLRARGFTCCLATNQQDVRRRHMSLELGYSASFDREYYSCEIRQRKPDAAFFQHILNDLVLAPIEVLFVDDAEANVVAARDLGMETLYFDGGDLRVQVEPLLARAG